MTKATLASRPWQYALIAVGACLLAPPLAAQKVADPPAPPCADDPLFRQLDFTLGEWQVTSEGKNRAIVRMERALDGCAIQETWMRPAGEKGNGLGLFTYSRILGKWSYAWAADSGAATSFVGSQTQPGTVLFVTERPTATGKRVRHWSLIAKPDGGVRELSVASDDGGKSWITEYDLQWSKKAQ